MVGFPKGLLVGDASVSVINVGFLRFSLADVMNVPENDWRPLYTGTFDSPSLFPSQSIHISLPGASIVVDPGDYAISAPADSKYRPENYEPPPALTVQLRENGIHPEDVTHVIITHAHEDHFSGVTSRDLDGRYLPSFAGARYFLSRADWETPDVQSGLMNPDSVSSRTIGMLHRLGKLELVTGNRRLMSEVGIIAAPGETPGHQIVRLQSLGRTLYCLGDLYHHSIEVEHPSWVATWADPATNFKSRQALTEAAASENPVLVAAHMPVGRLETTSSGMRWAEIQ